MLDEVLTLIRADAEEDILTRGTQLYVALNGEELATAAFGRDGLGVKMREDTLHRIYCAGKPLTALAIAVLVDDGELSFHDLVGNALDNPPPGALGTVTVDQLLSHTAGLHLLHGPQTALVDWPMRRHLVDALVPRPSKAPQYAEYASWHLLQRVVEEQASCALDSFVRSRILRPVGVDDEVFIGMDRTQQERAGHRVAPNLSRTRDADWPMTFSTLPDTIEVVDGANGVIASMRGLGKVYDHLGRVLRTGEDGVVSLKSLQHLVRPAGRAQFDPVMQRECVYGHGFMTDLRTHDFGSNCSEESFGHSGYRGVTYAFHDPAYGATVAVHNNAITDQATALEFLRPARTDALLSAIAKLT